MWPAVALSLELATVTTLLLLLLGIPLAWVLARASSWWGEVASALVALPIVLPPTVIGFYLLILLGPHGPLGPLLARFGVHTLAFSFPGLVIGSVIYSLPFMVQPVRNAFRALGPAPWEAALTLRASPLDAFFSVALPLAQGGILTGIILSFAHTLGEFGVVLMIGGDIPSKTELLSIVIFNDVDNLQWREAGQLAAGMAFFSFLAVLAMFLAEKRMARLRHE
jgi:molybdate transport system permease protein